MKTNLNKLIIVSVLIVAVVLVIVLKNKTERRIVIEDKEEIVESIETSDLGSIDTFQPKPDDISQDDRIEIQIPENIPTKQIEKPVEIPETKKQKKTEKDILALVNNSKITESYLNEEYNSLPEQHKDMFKNDKEGYLDQLVITELLFQKAKEKGYAPNDSDQQEQMDAGIQKLLGEVSSNIEIPETELEQFYQENQSQMQGAPFEQVKNDIHNYLLQQKQGEVIERYIEELKSGAEIVLNEEWIKVQRASKPKNPLTEVLKNGKTTVLDMGSSSCVPCKMMKPIFEELETEYEGKANILLLEISDYRDIANKYKVRVIPTQIFFDKNGIQYWRHEGFLSKEDIIKKINESGA